VDSQRIRLTSKSRLLVLTGAGVSSESGIRTFRDSNGLWEEHPVEHVATPEGFALDPALVWRFYSERRRQAKDCSPNPGHMALARIEQALGPRFLLVTQNVDGLHRRAGSNRLTEIHGSLFETRCSGCDREPFADEGLYLKPPLPECDLCDGQRGRSLLRPNIVWFGEMLDPAHLFQIEKFMSEPPGGHFVFLAVGTSGAVYPAAGLVVQARSHGAQTWLVNAEPPRNADCFENFLEGPSGRLLPELFDL
jgi:NAD-dependent deacetylase